MSNRIKHLEIILKISERCNINCSYCYVFNKGNSAADESPAFMSNVNIEALARFLEESCISNQIDNIQIDFHGGEPLMMKKQKFAWMCERLQGARAGARPLSLALQTNATLIDDEWIELFSRYNVHVSVSIDGTKKTNDLHRLDKKGRSTYGGTVTGLRKLQNSYRLGKIPQPPGLLCVINGRADGAETYRHFVDDLQVDGFDFLIPDDTHNDEHADNYGISQFLVAALDEWVKDDNPRIRVRIFDTHIARMLGAMEGGVLGHDPAVSGAVAFTVGSDGLARVDDTLRSTSDQIFEPIGHVGNITIEDVLEPKRKLS